MTQTQIKSLKSGAIFLEPPPVYEEPKNNSSEEDTYLQAITTGTTTGKWSVCWVLMAVIMVGLVVIGITSPNTLPNTLKSVIPDIKRSAIQLPDIQLLIPLITVLGLTFILLFQCVYGLMTEKLNHLDDS